MEGRTIKLGQQCSILSKSEFVLVCKIPGSFETPPPGWVGGFRKLTPHINFPHKNLFFPVSTKVSMTKGQRLSKDVGNRSGSEVPNIFVTEQNVRACFFTSELLTHS